MGPLADTSIKGTPTYISDDLSVYTNTTGTLANSPVIFGNFTFYGVVERPGMMIQRNPYLHMNAGIVSLFASIYRGGGVLQAEAFYGLLTK
jgi:HK97 family phage major capsid protein